MKLGLQVLRTFSALNIQSKDSPSAIFVCSFVCLFMEAEKDVKFMLTFLVKDMVIYIDNL